MFRIKRAYAPPAADDGARVLVDRLWPRGLARAGAALDLWLKEVAPSPALRRWFDHDPARFAVFATRYRLELATPAGSAVLAQLRALERDRGTVTLLFGARDEVHNHAVVLRDHLASIDPSKRA